MTHPYGYDLRALFGALALALMCQACGGGSGDSDTELTPPQEPAAAMPGSENQATAASSGSAEPATSENMAASSAEGGSEGGDGSSLLNSDQESQESSEGGDGSSSLNSDQESQESSEGQSFTPPPQPGSQPESQASAGPEQEGGSESVQASSNKDITNAKTGEVMAAESPQEAKEPEPAPAKEPEKEPVKEPVKEPEKKPENKSFSATVIGPDYPGAQCLKLPGGGKGFGSVQKSDWAKWASPLTTKYLGNGHYLEVKSADGRPYMRQKMVPSSRGSDRVGASAKMSSKRSYRLSQSVYFEPGFDWGGKNEGGKLGFGFGGGTTPSGGIIDARGFSVRFMWRGNRDGTAHLAIYSYAADRGSKYGKDIKLAGFTAPVGKWIDMAMEVTANSSTGSRDGTLKAWVNGELRVDQKNIGWQTAGSKPVIQELLYSTFYGGADPSWAPSRTTYIRFADVCWAPTGGASNDFVAQNDVMMDGMNDSDQAVSDGGLNAAEFSARATLNDSIERLDLLMPVKEEALDSALRETLFSINAALTPEDWATNDSLVVDSPAMANLERVANNLQSIDALGASEGITAEVDTVKIDLVGVASDLALASVERAKDAIAKQDCGNARKDARCDIASQSLAQAELDLQSAAMPDLYRSQAMAHAASGWRNAEAAIASLGQ